MPDLKRRNRKVRTIKYVSVIFKENSRQYTFKTIYDLRPGDKVVVRTKNNLGTGEVWDTTVPRPSFECNWVIGKVDLPSYVPKFNKDLKDLGINLEDK